MKRYSFLFALFVPLFLVAQSDCLRIGSKRCTESYILGEIVQQVAMYAGEDQFKYKEGLGNTAILFSALTSGSIDLYPEYSGTVIHELLHLNNKETVEDGLAAFGVGMAIPFGFQNRYALAVREEVAKKHNLRSLSDLLFVPYFRKGFSHEFLEREDGWKGLKKAYGFSSEKVVGLDHALCYEAMKEEEIDVMDVYSTDPKIDTLHLVLLEDDLHFFPAYHAVLLYRLDVPKRFSKTWASLQSLTNSISDETMREMNKKAELQNESFSSIAHEFIRSHLSLPVSTSDPISTLQDGLWKLTAEHFFLVISSLIPATFFGLFLGIVASRNEGLCSSLIIQSVGLIQTIPSLALLALLLSSFRQIGLLPALSALFLYALLPIVRNTYVGLQEIPRTLKESAIALGLSSTARLLSIELPLASRTILSGVKTAAIMNVGMATIAALIGAGGYGERIVAGLAINNFHLLLTGAIPAGLMAILFQLAFDQVDHFFVPKGLTK